MQGPIIVYGFPSQNPFKELKKRQEKKIDLLL